MASSGATFSVIGADVTIKGDVEASADLHVDGTVTGDLSCASLVQGESSLIEGAITAETARLSGQVKGTIKARSLVILKSARIEGDVDYETLTIEQGATVEGRLAMRDRRDMAKGAGAPPAAAAKDSEPKLSLAN
ncbi:bactofilin family protein [Alteraurantiacibacter aestuarii]|uniref:Polymer-forming cytoskeletal protein n=1 Tax=Alteraurantiacibacter aestuarii TaxID=650004 RepID=A0A844ZM13_9SPHN|nr:polymer-forming cytoskeletal protein [Alteraurantiacibacter aestuarii]MXO88633.1 polymer-forming cytoskeletal protein [Alteraurantiacibacter aestuarii]